MVNTKFIFLHKKNTTLKGGNEPLTPLQWVNSILFDYFCSMKRSLLILLLAVLAMPRAGAYNDHRGHNLDSLERAVARWTPDAIDKASLEDLLDINRAYRNLMLGYHVMNGDKCIFHGHGRLFAKND